MKIKKMVSEKVLAANRANAKMSTGPKNMAMVTHNAFKHGLLSKRLRFESEEERMLFQNLLEALKKEQKTESVLQQIIIVTLLSPYGNYAPRVDGIFLN